MDDITRLQDTVAALQAEQAVLRARNRELQSRLERLESDHHVEELPRGARRRLGNGRLSRAGMLKGVAAAGLAGIAATRALPAEAADGNALKIGQAEDSNNLAQSQTATFADSVSNWKGGSNLFLSDATNGGNNNVDTTFNLNGLKGIGNGNTGVGVVGEGNGLNGIGVVGLGSSVGVDGAGAADGACGVVGKATGSTLNNANLNAGVAGLANDTGDGVLGKSSGSGAAVHAIHSGTGIAILAHSASTGVSVSSSGNRGIDSIGGSSSGLDFPGVNATGGGTTGAGVVGITGAASIQNPSFTNLNAGVAGFGAGPGFGVLGQGGAAGVKGVGSNTTNATSPGLVGIGGFDGNESNDAAGVVGVGGGGFGAGVAGIMGGGSLPANELECGVYGDCGTNAFASGVQGTATHGFGVRGVSTTGIGIVATGGGAGILRVDGCGISASGSTYGGVFSASASPLLLFPAGTGGAPTTGAHLAGEVFVDKNGTFFICAASGTPGTWKQLATTDQGIHTIPTVRVLNTRPGKQIGPFTGPIANNTVLPLTLAGTNGIPANATGVIGNLTAADATAGCFLALVPHGANHVGVSSVNFPALAQGSGVANAFTVGLSSDGKVDIFTGNCSSYTVNIIMDISGYII